MKTILVALAVLSLAMGRGPDVAPQADQFYKEPLCETVWNATYVNGVLTFANVIGQRELTACLSLQYCSLWEREMCAGADLHFLWYEYENLGLCHYTCWFNATGEHRFGLTEHIRNW